MIKIEVVGLIIIGILLFELIIFFHEFGHFITAKWSGVKVNEFALGMGPKIFKFTKGETTYSLRLFPIGGFCAMEGEDEDSNDSRAFNNIAVWKRMIIVVAGAFMNIVLGLLMMLILVVQQPAFTSTVIDTFPEQSVTQQSLQAGDKFLSIDGYNIYNSKDIPFAMTIMKSFTPDVVVERDGEVVDLGKVQFYTYKNDSGVESVAIDFYVEKIPKTFLSVITETFSQTVSVVRMIWSSLVGLVTGQFGMDALSGPVGIATAISGVASQGLSQSFLTAFNNVFYVMMIITVNLGIVNMMPIPALDGGRFVFLLIELIIRKPIPQKYEGKIHAIGYALLMVIMVLLTFNDIWRLVTGSSFSI